MSQYWSEKTKQLSPYVPGEQRTGHNVVKLNTNENPYPPSAQVLDAIAQVTPDALRRYPDPQSTALREKLAAHHHISAEQVFAGNGSDEILALSFMAFFQREAPLQFPEISYSFYPVYCELFGITPHKISLNTDFSLALDQFGKQAADSCGGIIFPNPNAPTGMAITLAQIETLLQNNPDVVVLIDEAYADLGAESAIQLINAYPNLVVSQTFSKGRSLAGLRLGAAFASAPLIEGLIRVKDSFNSYPVDAIAQAAGIASINDDQYYRQTIENICATRDRTTATLKQLGFRVLPSQANFVFASPENTANTAEEIFNALNEKNILIRYWNKPALKDWLRITIGTDEEMDKLFAAVRAI